MPSHNIFKLVHYLTLTENCFNNTKNIDIIVQKLRRQYDYLDQAGIQFNYHSTQFKCLPVNIVHKIFKILDKLSLVYFVLAFPQYEEMIIQPVYWSKLTIKNNVLSSNEFNFLLKHLNISLKDLTVDFDAKIAYRANESMSQKDTYKAGILSLSDANKLILKTCSLAINLKYLDIKFKSLNSSHLFIIANNLTKLVSIHIHTELIIDDGLVYVLKKFNSLQGFGLKAPNADTKILELLQRKHSQSLEKLSFGLELYKIDESNLVHLKNFAKLVHLDLYNIVYSEASQNILDSLDNLQHFKLSLKNMIKPGVNISSMHHSFLRPKKYLKDLRFENIYIYGLCFFWLCLECRNVETLVLNECNVTNNGLEWGLQYLNKLKILELNQTKACHFKCFKFLDNIANGLLGDLIKLIFHIDENLFKADEIKILRNQINGIRSKRKIKVVFKIYRKLPQLHNSK